MRKGFLIYEEMRKYFPIYEEAVSQLLHSEFPHIWRKFYFLFHQCRNPRPRHLPTPPPPPSPSSRREKIKEIMEFGREALLICSLETFNFPKMIGCKLRMIICICTKNNCLHFAKFLKMIHYWRGSIQNMYKALIPKHFLSWTFQCWMSKTAQF
jgi:hypothetical protein